MITAKLKGPMPWVWLATSKESRARLMLTKVGEDWDTWQIDLADPMVARVLADGEATSFRVLAEDWLGAIGDTIPILESEPIRFQVLAGDNRELHARTSRRRSACPSARAGSARPSAWR